MKFGPAYQRGSILYQQHRYTQAADEFRKELSQNPDSVSAKSMLALSLNHTNKFKEALETARQAIASDPESAFAHYALACTIVGPGLQLGQKRPWRLYMPSLRVTAYRRKLRKARPSAMEALRLQPQNPDFLYLMSAIEFDLQRHKKALEWADKGLQANPRHVRCATLRARALAKLGRAHEAEQTIQGALAISPESAFTHAASGWTHLQSGDPDRAIEHFTESIRLNPNDPNVHNGLNAARRFTRTSIILIIIPIWLLIDVLSSLTQPSRKGGSRDPQILVAVFAISMFLIAARRLYRRRTRWKLFQKSEP